MNAVCVDLILPESVWLYMLQWEGQTNGWLLPFMTQPDPEDGRLWLVQQGMLASNDVQSVLDSALYQVVKGLMQTDWVLDVRTDDVRASLLHTPLEYYWASSVQGHRIRLTRADNPLRLLEESLMGCSAEYGLCLRGIPQWICTMPWETAKNWLSGQLEGE